MSLKFSEPKSINTGNMKMISVKTEEGKQVFVKTGKKFFFWRKKGQEI